MYTLAIQIFSPGLSSFFVFYFNWLTLLYGASMVCLLSWHGIFVLKAVMILFQSSLQQGMFRKGEEQAGTNKKQKP